MRILALLCAALIVCPAAAQAPRSVYVFSATHLDITFTGPPPLSYARAHRLFDAALKLSREQPNLRFVVENLYLLDEYLRTHPEGRAAFSEGIRAGRIEVAAQWTSMLQNLVTGEDLARNVLYANTLARERFGTVPRIQSLSDAPGQTGQAPQILREAGVDGLIITRAGPKDAHLFEWEGLDGTRLRTVNLLLGYPGGYLMGMADSLEAMEGGKLAEFELSDVSPQIMANRIKQPAGMEALLGFTTPKDLDRALVEVSWDNTMPPSRLDANLGAWNRKHGDRVRLIPSLPSAFVHQHWPDKTPTKSGDIPSVWFNGGWSLFNGYQEHIRTSHRLLEAEKWSALAGILLSKPYPDEEIRRGWYEHLITLDHEGHDLRDQAQEAASAANRVSAEARQSLASHVRIPGPQDVALVVFNPMNWTRTELVTADVALVGDPFAFFTRPWHKLRLLDSEEHPVPFEIVRSQSTIIRTITVRFRAEKVPPVGWRAYFLRPSEADESKKYPLPQTANAIQTAEDRIEFDRTSGVARLSRKSGTAEVRLRYYHQPEAESQAPGFFRQRDAGAPVAVAWSGVQAGESVGGPLLTLEGSVGGVNLRVEIHMSAGLPIAVSESVDWRGEKPIKLIRELEFPRGGQFVYGIPYGERKLSDVMAGSGPPPEGSTDQLRQEDWTRSREYDGWFAWDGAGKQVAVAGEQRGSRFDGDAVRTTLLYGGADLTRADFRTRFLIALDAGSERGALLGWEAAEPMTATVSVGLSGKLPARFTGVAEYSGAVLSALKRAEDGRGLIGRAYALRQGADFPRLGIGALRPAPASLVETPAVRSRSGQMAAHEIRTVRYQPSKP